MKKTLDMTKGSIVKAIILFSLPLILGNLLQQLYNAADSFIVGNFVSKSALGAVGAGGNIIYFMIAFFLGSAAGAGILISRYYGAGDREKLDNALHTTMALSVIMGLIITVAGIFMSPLMLDLLDTPADVREEAVSYLRIFFGGMIFNVIYNMGAGILNAIGDSRRSLVYLATASVTNIILDLLFVAVMGFGIEGAAAATVISQALSAFLVVLYFVRRPGPVHMTLKDMTRFDAGMAGLTLRIGIPMAIQNMVISFSSMFIQSGVNGYGTDAVAGFAAYMKVDGFNIMPIMSFSVAATTFISQNLGAGRKDRVRKGMRTVLLIGTVYSAVMSVIMLLFRERIIGIFSDDPDVIRYGVICIFSLAPYYVLLSLLHTLAGSVRGSGRTMPPMVIILLSLCGFRILWIKLMGPALFEGIWGVLTAYPASFTVGLLLMIIYTLKADWLRDYERL